MRGTKVCFWFLLLAAIPTLVTCFLHPVLRTVLDIKLKSKVSKFDSCRNLNCRMTKLVIASSFLQEAPFSRTPSRKFVNGIIMQSGKKTYITAEDTHDWCSVCAWASIFAFVYHKLFWREMYPSGSFRIRLLNKLNSSQWISAMASIRPFFVFGRGDSFMASSEESWPAACVNLFHSWHRMRNALLHVCIVLSEEGIMASNLCRISCFATLHVLAWKVSSWIFRGRVQCVQTVFFWPRPTNRDVSHLVFERKTFQHVWIRVRWKFVCCAYVCV